MINAAPGGGVLPYTTHNDRIKFLVGFDYTRNWSDFGGRADPGETPDQTAAREFSEETQDIFGVGNRATSINYVIQNNRLHVTHPNPRAYHMLLVPVPYIPAENFNTHGEISSFQWIDAANFLQEIQRQPTVGTAFNYQGQPYRDRFIDTVRNNVPAMMQLLFPTPSPVIQSPAPVVVQPAAAAATHVHAPVTQQATPSAEAKAVDAQLDKLSNELFQASSTGNRAKIENILSILMDIPEVVGTRTKKAALINEALQALGQ